VTPSLPIGQQLMKSGHIDAWQLQSALAHQERWGGSLVEAISEMGFVPEHVVLWEVGRQLGVPYVDVSDVTVPPTVLRLVPEKIVRARKVLPLRISQSTRAVLVIATSEPQNLAVIDELAFASGLSVEPVLASRRALDLALQRHLDPRPAQPRWTVELPRRPVGPMRLVAVGESVH
jgi:hypothetical protein